MKYLQPSFTLAVSDHKLTPMERRAKEHDEKVRRAAAKWPHEYENGGVMCLLCGLGDMAPIHAVYASLKRDESNHYSSAKINHKSVPLTAGAKNLLKDVTPGAHYEGVDEFGGSDY